MLLLIIDIVVPHITDAIQEWVERVAHISVDEDQAEPDICIIEVKLEEFCLKDYSTIFDLARWYNWGY